MRSLTTNLSGSFTTLVVPLFHATLGALRVLLLIRVKLLRKPTSLDRTATTASKKDYSKYRLLNVAA